MKAEATSTSIGPKGIFRVSSSAASLVPSGFGTVMEYERTLQCSTNERLQVAGGSPTGVIGRTLQNQSNRLVDVISLLERRCAMLPHPERFRTLARLPRRPPAPRPAEATFALLPDGVMDLLVQHRGLLERIRRLIRPHVAGDRGEAMLAEVVRSHTQMVWRLTTLLNEEAMKRRRATKAGKARPVVITTEGDWENEGGSLRPTSPASAA
jgi:hypothetical protein